MNRVLSCAAAGVIAIALAAGCSGDPESHQTVAPPVNPQAALPDAKEVIDVPVTRPEHPTPVDVASLPATARLVAQMPALTDDEKLCANYAIKTTVEHDPSIEKANAKMAGVMGNAIVACTPPAHLATIVSGGITSEGEKLSDEQRACLEQNVKDDTRSAARLLSALMTVDIPTIATASKRYDEVCKVSVVPR